MAEELSAALLGIISSPWRCEGMLAQHIEEISYIHTHRKLSFPRAVAHALYICSYYPPPRQYTVFSHYDRYYVHRMAIGRYRRHSRHSSLLPRNRMPTVTLRFDDTYFGWGADDDFSGLFRLMQKPSHLGDDIFLLPCRLENITA